MTPIGPYTVVGKLGAGGMGEVYRAHDTKLGRDVAIKVLPPALAGDADYIARFQREAQVLASLNHPNIAAIYGLEENAIVMELVEGAELRGPLPVEEAVRIAKQIADALEAAHERGIIHRDLKPANIRITPDGTVKVLDFGLAKAMEPAVSAASAVNSPTLTIHATTAGVILGTAAYMSPEQAAGKPVDRRADIWSFGVVLWEMLTGRQLFAGETVSHTLADVLRREIDFEAAPEGNLRDLLRRCLDRDVKTRLRDIGEARIALASPERPREITRRTSGPWWVAGAAVLTAAVLGALWMRSPQAQSVPLMRFTITPKQFAPDPATQAPAISPDGKQIAYVAGSTLWLRRLDEEDAKRVATSESGVLSPVWSPDSKQLAWWADGQIWRSDPSGGSPVPVVDQGVGPRLTWSADGKNIVHSTGVTVADGSAEGGARRRVLAELGRTRGVGTLTTLPLRGRRVLILEASFPRELVLADLDTDRIVPLGISGFTPAYSPAGYLLFGKASRSTGSDIWAVRFPLDTLKPAGEPVRAVLAATAPSVSNDGTLVYVESALFQVMLRDRSGQKTGSLGVPESELFAFDVAPDGARLATASHENGNTDIWVHDTGRGVKSRLSSDAATDTAPKWSPDGQFVYWSVEQVGEYRLVRKRADGAGAPEVLLSGQDRMRPEAWSPDGRLLFVTVGSVKRYPAYVRSRTDGEGYELVRLLDSGERYPRLSPNGRYVLYHHLESQEPHVFVRRFPSGNDVWRVSTTSVSQNRWSPDGREIFSISGKNMLTAIPVNTGEAFSAGRPKALFEVSPYVTTLGSLSRFEVLKDGRFAVIEPVPVRKDQPVSIGVVQNWVALLNKGGQP